MRRLLHGFFACAERCCFPAPVWRQSARTWVRRRGRSCWTRSGPTTPTPRSPGSDGGRGVGV
eukprot:10101509-Lingulodinium_polyedra.AAC.1